MGLGNEDMKLLLNLRKEYTFGKTCAILGDCTFWFNNGSKENFKNLMGFDTVHTFDILGNPDYKLDLQEQLDVTFECKYDWILDVGTLYCVFDIASVWKNILYMLSSNGYVWHQTNLVGHFGRGFYALSPSVFNEFYKANGFEVKSMGYYIKGGKNIWQPLDVGCNYMSSANMNEIKFVDNNCSVRQPVPCDTSLMCFAERKHITEFKKPVPEHYIRTNGK